MAVASKSYRRQYEELWSELLPALERTFFEDEPVLGEAVARFEAALASYHEVGCAVGVGSGMSAIELVLGALGARGGEVVTGAHTFSGVLSAIVLAGATPVLVDAEEDGMLPIAAVRAALGPRTRAILGVHMYGHPVDAGALAVVAREHQIPLVEDAAQAHGARWRGRPVGSFGTATALSFHPSKNLGAFGDGGAILTNDRELAARLCVTRNLGKDGKYSFREVAPNSKLDTLQAVILELKLRHLDSWISRRRAFARRYEEGLRGVGDLVLPSEHPEARHAYHLYVVRTSRREALRSFLAERGINAGLHYPIAAHKQEAHAERFRGQSFPVAERIAETCLTLPLSHEHTDDEIATVVSETRAFFAR